MVRYLTIFNLIFYTLIGLHSCKPIMYKIYGIEPIKSFDQNKYNETIKFFNSNNFENNVFSYLGEAKSFDEYSSLDTVRKNTLKQPIQILYFEGNVLKSFHANCFAKGSMTGNLNWNYDNKFNSFIPKSAINLEKTDINLSDIKRIYNITDKTQGITIVFFWTNFLRKNSLEAFKVITNNLKSYSMNNDITILTINTDYSFIYSD